MSVKYSDEILERVELARKALARLHKEIPDE